MGRFEVVGFYVECCLRFEAAVARMLEYETNCWEHTTSRALPHPQCDEWLLLCLNLVTLAEPTERILCCILFHISASFVFHMFSNPLKFKAGLLGGCIAVIIIQLLRVISKERVH